MNIEQFLDLKENNGGFWVNLKHVDDYNLTTSAKLIFEKNGDLTMYTLLENGPEINIFEAGTFAFVVSNSNNIVFYINANGKIHDLFEDELYDTKEEYVEHFFEYWYL